MGATGVLSCPASANIASAIPIVEATMAGSSDAGFVTRPGGGRVIDLEVFRMSVLADAAATGGAFSLLEASEPPGFGPPLHIHHDAAEAFYVLEGEYRIFLDDREFRCPAGSFIFIPAGRSHGFQVGAVASRKLNLYAPAGMVGYFDELAVGGEDATDPEALARMARRYGMEVIGPVPDSYVRGPRGSNADPG